MIRILAAALASLFMAACATAPPVSAQAGARRTIDIAAESYVRLALEIDTHEEGYVDAYFGPAEWREQARAHPRSVANLKVLAETLQETLAQVSEETLIPVEARRLRALRTSLASARFRLDMIDGVRVPFSEEAERIFALRPTLHPLESFEPALARIDALVPGQGPLSERVEAFRARYAIPIERIPAVMDAAIAECRRRTGAHLPLPDNEGFHMELVSGRSWSAYNWYQGEFQSLIQVNTQFPVLIDRALGLACHEGYPGHHVQGIYNERNYRERGWVEFSVAPLFHPTSPLNEGGANFSVDLAFPGAERAAFERDVLYPLAGLDPASAQTYEALRLAAAELAGARLTIAAMYLDGEIDRARALNLIQHYQLMSPARAEQSLSFTEHYRAYVINYVSGEDMIRAFVDRAGADPAARWAAYESTMSQPTLPQDLAP